MNIKEALKGIEYKKLQGTGEEEIENISYDSRKVSNNHVFVCITGYETDGHKYIDSAIENGATVIIVEKDVKVSGNIAVFKVTDARKTLSKMASNFFGNPSEAIFTFGVTGTNGKTTTTYMINEILKHLEKNCGVIGTISYNIGDKKYDSVNTTPESYELQKMFAEMKTNNIENCSMEVSSHSLALNRVADIAFDIGLYTNLTQDHLDFHNTLDEYYEAKKSLFFMTKKHNVVNIDDEYGRKLVEDIKDLEVPYTTYGIHNKADVKAVNIELHHKYTRFEVYYKDKLMGSVNLNILGIFSVYNALATIAATLAYGASFEKIKEGLEGLQGVPGRFEIVRNTKGHTVIVDYAHTPDALLKVLEAAKEFKENKIICVFGCGGERDKTKRPIMGKIAGENADYCIITSDNPRHEDPVSILIETEAGIKETNCKYEIIEDRYEAIKRAIEIYEENDIIVLAGKGHEDYQVIGDEKIHFDDREVASELIEKA